MRCANPMIFENQDNQFSYSISDFLIWAENDLALFPRKSRFGSAESPYREAGETARERRPTPRRGRATGKGGWRAGELQESGR